MFSVYILSVRDKYGRSQATARLLLRNKERGDVKTSSHTKERERDQRSGPGK